MAFGYLRYDTTKANEGASGPFDLAAAVG